ncbi:unnamed protein product [Brachionus calyciflorus]|uniref:WSC domain-containing protein n=1 Tax=Brachionus calyciflorus TaxID=104777 RepID=A0A814KBE4_9BILA|nr:unnamed protein product [Brachionus calyciflorus]
MEIFVKIIFLKLACFSQTVFLSLNNSTKNLIYEDAYYIGCYKDNAFFRDLRYGNIFSNYYDINDCFSYCRAKNFEFAGTQYNNQSSFYCFCDNRYGTIPSKNEISNCFCKKNAYQFYGCSNNNRVYRLKNRTTISEISFEFFGCFEEIKQIFLQSYFQDIPPVFCSEHNFNIFSTFNSSFTCLKNVDFDQMKDDFNLNSTFYSFESEMCEKSGAISVYYIQKVQPGNRNNCIVSKPCVHQSDVYL